MSIWCWFWLFYSLLNSIFKPAHWYLWGKIKTFSKKLSREKYCVRLSLNSVIKYTNLSVTRVTEAVEPLSISPLIDEAITASKVWVPANLLGSRNFKPICQEYRSTGRYSSYIAWWMPANITAVTVFRNALLAVTLSTRHNLSCKFGARTGQFQQLIPTTATLVLPGSKYWLEKPIQLTLGSPGEGETMLATKLIRKYIAGVRIINVDIDLARDQATH